MAFVQAAIGQMLPLAAAFSVVVRILQVCKKFPYPAIDGESIAVLQHTRGFAQAGHEVVVAAMNTKKHYFPADQLPENLRQLAAFHAVPVDTGITLGVIGRSVFHGRSFQIERFVHSSFKQLLVSVLRQVPVQLIQLEGSYLLPYVRMLRRHSAAPVVLRAHNLEHQIWESQAAAEPSWWRRWLLRRLSLGLKRFERKHVNDCDAVVAISQADAAGWRLLDCRRPIFVSEVGVEVPQAAPPLPEPPVLFFIGSMDWLPNQTGIVWFLREVWPGLRREFPQLTFRIAGRNFPQWLRRCECDGVYMEGEVADAAAFMRAGSVLVVPLFSGSGIRVKIIEALALGRPVVATPLGASGISEEAANIVLTAQSAEEFTNRLRDLLADAEKMQRLSQAGHAFAHHRFSQSRLTEQLLNFYQSLLS